MSRGRSQPVGDCVRCVLGLKALLKIHEFDFDKAQGWPSLGSSLNGNRTCLSQRHFVFRSRDFLNIAGNGKSGEARP